MSGLLESGEMTAVLGIVPVDDWNRSSQPSSLERGIARGKTVAEPCRDKNVTVPAGR